MAEVESRLVWLSENTDPGDNTKPWSGSFDEHSRSFNGKTSRKDKASVSRPERRSEGI